MRFQVFWNRHTKKGEKKEKNKEKKRKLPVAKFVHIDFPVSEKKDNKNVGDEEIDCVTSCKLR